MMSRILILITFLPAFLIAQETKKITKTDDNTGIKEIYYVLKSNKSLRHGNYKKYGFNQKLAEEGFYKNGQKDSIWYEYSWSGKKLRSTGLYSEDNKIGVWEYYDFQENLEQKYDYTKNELVYSKTDEKDKDKIYKIINGFDTIQTILDRPPIYLGGIGAITDFIVKNIYYPEEAIENNISGEVLVIFTIKSDGEICNYRVSKGIGFHCDEEALRIVKKIPENWFPGVFKGSYVNVEYELPINFYLH
jgi:protein TonB